MNSLAYIISFLVVLVVIYVFTDSQTTVITGVALAGAVAIQQTIKYFTQNIKQQDQMSERIKEYNNLPTDTVGRAENTENPYYMADNDDL